MLPHDIIVGALLLLARDYFKKRLWSFQQDSAPYLGTEKTQEWLSENVLHFITKEEWAPPPPNLNPLDFGIWSYLESEISTVLPSKFGNPKGQNEEGMGQNPTESHS